MKRIPLKSFWPFMISWPLILLLCIPSFVLIAHLPHLSWLWTTGDELSSNAMWISIETSTLSTLITLILGTPIAWYLAHGYHRFKWLLSLLITTPLVLPPSIVGLTLLSILNPNTWIGQTVPILGDIAFSWSAVILAQLAVSSPIYIMGASSVFKQIDPEMLEMAQSLGASPWQSWRRVALPIVLPGLLVALSLTWARAIGEFGATLLFAGHLPEVTQTIPLAIYLELDNGTLGALALALGLLTYMLPILALSVWFGRSPWRA